MNRMFICSGCNGEFGTLTQLAHIHMHVLYIAVLNGLLSILELIMH